MENLYKKFEALLEQKGVTAYQVAKDTGIAQATLTEWKKNTYTPKIDKLKKIADYFGVSIEYFLAEDKLAQDGGVTVEKLASGG